MIVHIIFVIVFFFAGVILCRICNNESSVDSLSIDSPPETNRGERRSRAPSRERSRGNRVGTGNQTAVPMQVPFQQSNTPPPMHPPTMQSYQGPSTNVPPLPTSNPPPPIAGTNQFCPPPDLPPPPPYAGSTWN